MYCWAPFLNRPGRSHPKRFLLIYFSPGFSKYDFFRLGSPNDSWVGKPIFFKDFRGLGLSPEPSKTPTQLKPSSLISREWKSLSVYENIIPLKKKATYTRSGTPWLAPNQGKTKKKQRKTNATVKQVYDYIHCVLAELRGTMVQWTHMAGNAKLNLKCAHPSVLITQRPPQS